MPDEAWRALGPARQRAGLSVRSLHLRYIALGGTATSRELGAHLTTGTGLAGLERELVVQSINERFLELGMAERLSLGSAGGPD